MEAGVPEVRFRVAGGDETRAFWLPRRLIVLHLDRGGDAWVAATSEPPRDDQETT